MSQSEGTLEDLHRAHELDDPISELRREHVEVAGPLLDRMAKIADLLDDGTNVEPAQIAEGIELWEAYLHGTHRTRLGVLGELPASSCAVAVREVRENHLRAPERMARLRTFLEAYSVGLPDARGMLALGLQSDVLVDRAWVSFEEEHPFACLSGRLSRTTNERVRRAFAKNLKETNALEEKVQRYLAQRVANRPDALEIRCNVASCPGRTTVRWASVPPAGVRISPPGDGWVMRALDPTGRGSARSSRLAFLCPRHAGPT
jgi:hypothetical protein